MQCVIYKSDRRRDTYLYVEREDDFTRVPPALLNMLGNLQRVMILELNGGRTLAQADTGQVRHLLMQQGYFLQMPPGEPASDSFVRQ